MNINTDIDILLAKYFSGETSAKELSMLEDWIAASEENQACFDEMTLIYEKSAHAVPPRAANTEKAWDMFEQHMQQSNSTQQNSEVKKPTGKIKIQRYIQVAAAVVILIAASFFLFTTNSEDNGSIYIVSTESIVEHTLPDSSKILLSENSSISYDQDYGDENKLIALTGKASFNISDAGSDKLVVSIGETFIKDIGTIFTVDENTDNHYISVNVESGVVLFYTAQDSGLSLYAGETGYFNKAAKQFSKQVDGKTVAYNQIVFDATPLYKVVERLGQQFDTTIILTNDSLNGKQITVSFDQDEGIDRILQIVAETLRLNLSHENGVYTLSPL